MFIVIEGVDAAGKATQSKMLAERFKKQGREVALHSFPRYETPLGEAILRHLKGRTAMMEMHIRDSSDMEIDGETVYHKAKEDPLVFQCLMLADKYDAACEIEHQINEGMVVVADRWAPSAICYGAADGLSMNWLMRTQSYLIKPDFCIYIEVSPEVALQRRPKMRDRYEKDREKQRSVREHYDRLWDMMHESILHTNSHWCRIDGNRTIEEVHEQVWKVVGG